MTDIPLWRRPTCGGWRIEADEARTRVDVIDPAGQVRASVAIEPVQHFTGWFAKRQNAVMSREFEAGGPSLPAREPIPITLRPHDEQAFVSDGASNGHRREKPVVPLSSAGTTRFFTPGGRPPTRCGTRIASFVKHGFGPKNGYVSRDDHCALDETDELVLTIFEKLLKPGRPGAVSDILTDLT